MVGRDRGNPVRAPTEAIEDYLKCVYKLSARGGRATVGRMATALRLSAPSVTNMVKKMAALGLVEHAPYGGITLTPRGVRIALEIIRHHRLWELYLSRRLGLPLERVHAEAERLEHVLSDEMERRMAVLLGDPGEDPHGDPIPSLEGRLRRAPHGRRLSELAGGEEGVIIHLSDRAPAVLKAVAARGLLPGVRVRVVERRAGGRGCRVLVGRRTWSLTRDETNLVRVT